MKTKSYLLFSKYAYLSSIIPDIEKEIKKLPYVDKLFVKIEVKKEPYTVKKKTLFTRKPY